MPIPVEYEVYPTDFWQFLDEDQFDLYDDIDDVPVDFASEDEIPPEWRDGDDSVLGLFGGAFVREESGVWVPGAVDNDITEMIHEANRAIADDPTQPLLGAPRMARRRVVPFPRMLKKGNSGRDVRAMQRALAKSQRKNKRDVVNAVTGKFGNYTVKALKDFQKRKGLEVDGVYGKQTHKALSPFYDAYGISMMTKAKKKREAGPSAVARIEACALFHYNNRAVIHYTQGPMRMQMVRNGLFPPRLTHYEDCSSEFTGLYCYGKVRDPNGGTAYTGAGSSIKRKSWPQGYTGTQINHGRRHYGGKPARCSGVFYGSGGISHVTTKIGTGVNCQSHGSEIGPLIIPYNYRAVRFWHTYPGLPTG